MRKDLLALGVIFAGLALAGFSFCWPLIVRWQSPGWTEEQAQVHAKASSDLHFLAHARGDRLQTSHNDPQSATEPDHAAHAAEFTEQAYRKARADFEKSDAELQRAQRAGESAAAWMKWLGIAVALAGVMGYFQFREKPEG